MGVKPYQKYFFVFVACMESVGCIAMEEFNFQHIHEYFMLQQDFSSPHSPALSYIVYMFSWQCIYTPSLVLSSLILRLFPFILIFLCFILPCIILPCAILSCDFYVLHSRYCTECDIKMCNI